MLPPSAFANAVTTKSQCPHISVDEEHWDHLMEDQVCLSPLKASAPPASVELTSVVQIISAIQIAWDPAADQTLKRQAFEYVNQLRNEPSVWQPCLSVFVRQPPQAEVVRVFCLEIVNSAVQAGLLDEQGLKVVKDQLLEYLRQSYGTGDGPSPDSTSIENKLAQTITYLFSAIYSSGWESCFDDLLSLTTTQPGTRNNAKGIAFYLRVVNSIHDEIGDVLLSRSRSEQDKANTLKDLLRDRDVRKIAISWQEILSQWRTSNDLVAELCLKAIGKWVSWIDISLVVNQSHAGVALSAAGTCSTNQITRVCGEGPRLSD